MISSWYYISKKRNTGRAERQFMVEPLASRTPLNFPRVNAFFT
jgi:hypothetical protein